MLVQFAQMGAAFAAKRYGVERPRVALLSIGEEKSKGTPLEKEVHALLAGGRRRDRLRIRGQRRGPGLLRRHRRRDRDRRLHRQRGPQDHGGHPAVSDRGPHRDPGPARGRRGRPRPSHPAPAPLWPPPRPRQHRRGHAVGRGRRVCDQPRLLVGGGHGQRHHRGPRPGRGRTGGGGGRLGHAGGRTATDRCPSSCPGRAGAPLSPRTWPACPRRRRPAGPRGPGPWAPSWAPSTSSGRPRTAPAR